MATKPVKKPAPDPYIGKRIRVDAEGEVVARYPAGPTAPDRVAVRIEGIFTIVPVKAVQVLP